MKNPTERFTETVQDYIKYRPSYPPEVLQTLIDDCGLTRDKVIVDIGSGTGLLTKLLLDHGVKVYGVEPNQAMRQAGENYLRNYSNFNSVDGTAEATTLANQSVDIITAATAFHWFDPVKTKLEFKRIIKPSGWVLLVWNVRDATHSDFLREYEELLLKYGTDFAKSAASRFDKTALENFFDVGKMHIKSFKNTQEFNWEGLRGRLLSASYSPRPSDANYEEMMLELRRIFDKYQKSGVVEFLYATKLYYGQL